MNSGLHNFLLGICGHQQFKLLFFALNVFFVSLLSRFFIFGVQQFDYDILGILFRFYWVSWTCKFILFTKFRVFSNDFVKTFFLCSGSSLHICFSIKINIYKFHCQCFCFILLVSFDSIEFSSIAQSCPTLCNPMNRSMPGLPVHHQLLELTQAPVGDAIQPSYPLSSPSPPTFNLSQHQGLFQWVSSSHQVARVLEFQLQHQSFQWIFRTDFL